MNDPSRLRGLYVITDTALSAQQGMDLKTMVEQAIAGGARLVQYRAKEIDAERKSEQATDLLGLCRAQDVTFIINDDVALAAQLGADGVHLGQSDTGLDTARRMLGPQAIIGVSCHGDLDLARHASAAGADYVAFGRFFASQTKPEAPPSDINILREARAQLQVPIAAIGGITPQNGADLIAAGADMLAVIHGVFGQTGIAAAAGRFAALFASTPSRASR